MPFRWSMCQYHMMSMMSTTTISAKVDDGVAVTPHSISLVVLVVVVVRLCNAVVVVVVNIVVDVSEFVHSVSIWILLIFVLVVVVDIVVVLSSYYYYSEWPLT